MKILLYFHYRTSDGNKRFKTPRPCRGKERSFVSTLRRALPWGLIPFINPAVFFRNRNFYNSKMLLDDALYSRFSPYKSMMAKKSPTVTVRDIKTNIEDTLNAIKTKFGEDSIMKLGEKPKVNVDVVPTGSIGLDAALGVGGLPRGRIVEIFGPESSGKTTLALHVVAEAQKKGGVCAYIDAEHAMD